MLKNTPIPASEIDQAIASFRRFNRFYTRFLGLLDEDLIDSGYALTEARILFELATRKRCGASEIASELNLDGGYLSRILRKFEDAGLLARSPSPADARHDILRLTRKGQRAFADLNARSVDQARGILQALTPSHRSALIRSMGEIETALDTSVQSRSPFGPAPAPSWRRRMGDPAPWRSLRAGIWLGREL
jgi:DNA-binding MarR family transcriptional regulator